MTQNPSEGGRIAFIDYLRATACFLVMLVHASETFYAADSSGLAGNVSMLANSSNRLWVSVYDGFFGRISVPLFMIVSAFLLVPMKSGQTMGSFYKRRFSRILPPMLLYMLLYCLLPLAWGGMSWEQSRADLLNLPFNFPSMAGHLWFMYPLISLYLIIPVISPWLEKASAREELGFLGLFGFSTLIPWIHVFISGEVWGECFWNEFTALWYCSGFIGYMVMAHYIRHHLGWERRRKLAVGTVCFIAGCAFTAWSFWWKGVPGQVIETPLLEWSWRFCTPNVLLGSFGAFLLFSCIERPSAPALVTGLSKLSFGMYLMHLFFLAPIARWIASSDVASPLLPVWLAIPVIAILSYICCALTTWLLSKIPALRWLAGV